MSIVVNEKLGNNILLLGVGSGMTANANMMETLMSHPLITNSCLGMAAAFTIYAGKGIVDEINRQSHAPLPPVINPAEASDNIKLGNLSKLTGGISLAFNGAFVITQYVHSPTMSALTLATFLSVITGAACFKGGHEQVRQARGLEPASH